MAKPSKKPVHDGATTLRIQCGKCGVGLVADRRNAGKPTTCPGCGAGIVIPERNGRASLTNAAKGRIRSPGQAAEPDRPVETLRAAEAAAPAEAAPAGQVGAEPAPESLAHLAPAALATESHRTRANLAAWLRRVAIVVLAFAVVKAFEAVFASVLVRAPADLHAAVGWILETVGEIPDKLRYLGIPRPAESYVGTLLPVERFMLGIGMLLYATRLVIRTKLLDAVYVVSPRWRERTCSGLVIHFLAALFVAGLLSWAASSAKSAQASDGLTCGLIAAMLWASAIWLTTLHLVASNEYPELTKWMVTDAVFGLLILFVVIWPGITQLWSRAGATAVLLLADSAAALHVGASFVFARRKRRWWWHKPLTIVVSLILVVAVAVMLACSR